jgi:RNA polymerase sigma-70 factor (ECF subfamily)
VCRDENAKEMCLAVLTALPSYRRDSGEFPPFVYGIAAHKVFDAHRAAAHTRTLPVLALPDEPVAPGRDGPEATALAAEATTATTSCGYSKPDNQDTSRSVRATVAGGTRGPARDGATLPRGTR